MNSKIIFIHSQITSKHSENLERLSGCQVVRFDACSNEPSNLKAKRPDNLKPQDLNISVPFVFQTFLVTSFVVSLKIATFAS